MLWTSRAYGGDCFSLPPQFHHETQLNASAKCGVRVPHKKGTHLALAKFDWDIRHIFLQPSLKTRERRSAIIFWRLKHSPNLTAACCQYTTVAALTFKITWRTLNWEKMFELGLPRRTTERSNSIAKAQFCSVQSDSGPSKQTPQQQRRTLRGSRADHGMTAVLCGKLNVTEWFGRLF